MRRTLERIADYLPAALATAFPIAFLPGAYDSFVLPRAALVIAGACVGVGLVLITGRAASVAPLKWFLVAALGAAMISFAFSVSWSLSTAGSYERYESWPMRLAYLGLFVSAACLLRSSIQCDWVIRGFVYGTTIASFEAVGQAVSGVPFRPDGNVGNANLLGALIAMAIPLAIGRGLNRSPYIPLWWLSVSLMLAGLIVSTSRSGLLGAIAAVMTLVVMSQRGRPAAVAAGSSAAIVAFGLIAIVFSPLRLLNGDPGASRLYLWPDALRMIAARPLTGWGEDAVGLVFGRFLRADYAENVIFDRAHSGPLDLLATQGLIGVLALGGLLAVIALTIWRRRFDDSVAILGAAGVGYTVWVAFNFDWAPATGPFWLLAGTAWAATRAQHADINEGQAPMTNPVAGLRPAMAGLASIALALVGIALGVMPLLADVWYDRGRPDLSVIVDPLQAQYHRGLGESLVATGSTSNGLAELRKAAWLGASDPTLFVELGDLELSLGDSAQARADYREALKFDPYWTPAKQRLASLPPTG